MRTNFIKLIVFCLAFFVSTEVSAQQNPTDHHKFTVVLDAGHGGKDPGNRGNGYFEKDIALNIVKKIGDELEKLPDVKVIYTRKTDVFVELHERAKIANDANADLFVSVHCNSHNSSAHGTETFVLGLRRSHDNMEIAKRENSVIYMEEDHEATYNNFDPNSPESHISFLLMQEEYLDQSILLAKFIQNNFTNKLKRTNRGVKQDVFLVLRETYMPSVLVETGFLTNKEEGAYLNAVSGQSKMATAIVEAIVAYKNSINLASFDEIMEVPPVTAITTSETFTDIYKDIEFKIQLAATSKKIEPSASNFKGLNPISSSKDGRLHKYYYGATSSYRQAQQMQEEAKRKGFTSSFVVAFKKGKKVSVNEALKSKVN